MQYYSAIKRNTLESVYIYTCIYTTYICIHTCIYTYIYMHTYIYIYMYTMYILYHSFFIHSSVDGHLGCFHVPAIVNSAAMNNGIHVSLSILISSGYMPRSGISGSYGGSIPSFFKESPSPVEEYHPPQWLYQSTFPPTKSARTIPFLHALSSIYCL